VNFAPAAAEPVRSVIDRVLLCWESRLNAVALECFQWFRNFFEGRISMILMRSPDADQELANDAQIG
jgi:hypothetical protein